MDDLFILLNNLFRLESRSIVQSLSLVHVQLHPPEGERFSKTFEALAEDIAHWSGMYFEMDGSFVWVDHSSRTSAVPDAPKQQMDGMVYDRDGAIEYIEIKGTPSRFQWQSFLQALLEDSNESSDIGGSDVSIELSDLLTERANRLRIYDVRQGVWVRPTIA